MQSAYQGTTASHLAKRLLILLAGITLLIAEASAQNVEVAFSSRIEVNGSNYTGDVSVKAVIIDSGLTTLWSNDNSSISGSEPATSFTTSVTDSIFTLYLGGSGTTALPAAIFDGDSPLFLVLWMNAGEGLQRFDPIPLALVPRAVSALRLGGRPASEYLTTSSILTIGNANLSEDIASENLEAFSDDENAFTIGDGAATLNKELRVDSGTLNSPALRYDVGTSSWQFSNDGVSFLNLGSTTASNFVGSGSASNAVDLDTAETDGILPITKGGTGSPTALLARTALGLEIGVDVAAFTLHNLSATTSPSANDDSLLGYEVGSLWIDTVADQSFVAVDVSVGAAIWQPTSFVAANSVTSASIVDNSLSNDDISTAAAISHDKLATIPAGSVLLGNAGNTPTATAITGDLSLNSAGTATIANGAVTGGKIGISGQTQGDLLYFDGSTWERLAAGSSGTVLTSSGVGSDPAWVAPGAGFAPHPVTNRRLAWSFPVAMNSSTLTSVGMSNPTVTAAGTAQPALAGASRMFVRYATTAVANNTNGITGPLTQTRPAFRPTYATVIRTDSTIVSRRIWIGLTSAALAALPTNTTATPASTASFVAIAYDTSGVGNTTDWLCCSGDSANYSCTTTGISVSPDTEYTMIIDWSTLGSLTCTVNGSSVVKTTNLSTATVNIGPYSSIRTLTAAVANHFIAKQSLEQN